MSDADRFSDAAARALIAERCQRTYLHEIRGGLQALSGAVELLTRLARSGDGDGAVVDRAALIAKRALTNHESAMVDMVKQMAGASERAERVDLGLMVDDIVRFLRNDMAARQVEARLEKGPEVCLEIDRNALRFLLIGLFTERIDAAPGGELSVRVERRDGEAVLELRSRAGPGPDPAAADRILELLRHWTAAHGGRLEQRSDAVFALHLPVRAREPV